MKKIKSLLCALTVVGLLGCGFVACADSSGNSNTDTTSQSSPAPEKQENTVSLSVKGKTFCGDSAPEVEVSATYGTPALSFAKADGVTQKENLTYLSAEEVTENFFSAGTYYVKASVAETENYESGVAYAEFAVEHQEYAEIQGEIERVVELDKETQAQGYSVKKCACGEEIQGEFIVWASVTLDGESLFDGAVKIGEEMQVKFPTRDNYVLKLYKDGKAYEFNAAVSNFTALELNSRWLTADGNYDYVADVETKLAYLPKQATFENAEVLLQNVADIEKIINAHYTEKEKAGLPTTLAELKAAAQAIIDSVEYQLDKRLSAIPEMEEMTDETATLYAVLDYVGYVERLSEADLADYEEPRKISIYKHYFSGEKVLISGLNQAVESNASKEDSGLVLYGAENGEYSFTLPCLPYSLTMGAKTILTFGQANTSYEIKAYGTTFVNVSQTWNWLQIVKVGAEGLTVKDTDTGADLSLAQGYYLAIGNTDVGAEWYKYAQLPESVVSGAEGLTFTVKPSDGAWDWMKFRQDGGVAKDNLYGGLAGFETEKAVYTVSFTYQTQGGEKTVTQYYLGGETIVAPQAEQSYSDEIGTHTFIGWGELADTVTQNLSYTANYQTEYKKYGVTFLDADYEEFASKTDYRYGDTIVLPETAPEKAKEGDWKFVFSGWYNGDEEVTSATKVLGNMEIEPRFTQVYDGAVYVITVEGLGETQTYDIPVVADLQAEALAQIPAVPEKALYSFLGYFDKETGEEVDVSVWTAIDGDKTLVAKWQPAYINMANALPATAEDIQDENKTYADLVDYIALLGEYSQEELEDYVDPLNVVLLKTHYAGVKKIYTFTTTADENLQTTARFETVANYGETWFQDDRGNAYGGYIQATFDVADGLATVILPKFKFNAYKEVSFGISMLSTGTGSLSVNGEGAMLSQNSAQNFFTAVIKDGVCTLHAMNDPATVQFTANLTAAQLKGEEGIVLSVEESGWTCIWISHIHGELQGVVADEQAQEEILLAKLPADTASISNEAQTFADLIEYLDYVAKNPKTDYVQPAKVGALKAYYADRNMPVVSNLMASVQSNANLEAGNGLIMTGAADNTYTFALPKINYSLFKELSCITVFGQANNSYEIKAYGTTFANVSKTWNWLKIVKVGAEGLTVKDTDTGADLSLAEGYYLTIGNTDVGAEWYKYVQLSENVVNGEESLTFSITTSNGAWDWMKFRQDGGVETDNLVGKLA